MLGFALDPREDELVYSVLARYAALIGRADGSTLVREFLGVSGHVAAIDLPAGMRHFAARLGGGADPVTLIQNHTLFPYLYRFASEGQSTRARQWLLEGGCRRPARIGVSANVFELPDHLMFCPTCVRSDLRSGISVWRRVHQLPGVLLCPDHGTALARSRVSRKNRRGLNAFVALTQGVAAAAETPGFSRRERRDLLGFAQGSERLLEAPSHLCSLPDFQRRLRELLGPFRWTRAPSLMASTELVGAFRREPAVQTLMSALGVCWTDAQVATALNRLIYGGDRAKHPLMVMIVLRIAGATLDDLFGSTPKGEPRASRTPVVRTRAAPRVDLPCRNPACERHTGPVAALIGAGRSDRTRARCPACRFTYVWDPARPGHTAVVETAPSWDRMLLDLLSNPDLSVREVGRRLGVAPNTVVRHARRLGLWRPEWKDRPKVQLKQATRPARLLEKHRAAWLQSRAAETAAPIKRMPRPAFNAYRYLMKHDRAWMRDNGTFARSEPERRAF